MAVGLVYLAQEERGSHKMTRLSLPLIRVGDWPDSRDYGGSRICIDFEAGLGEPSLAVG
jgi:hypothetical protein